MSLREKLAIVSTTGLSPSSDFTWWKKQAIKKFVMSSQKNGIYLSESSREKLRECGERPVKEDSRNSLNCREAVCMTEPGNKAVDRSPPKVRTNNQTLTSKMLVCKAIYTTGTY